MSCQSKYKAYDGIKICHRLIIIYTRSVNAFHKMDAKKRSSFKVIS